LKLATFLRDLGSKCAAVQLIEPNVFDSTGLPMNERDAMRRRGFPDEWIDEELARLEAAAYCEAARYRVIA
jgi:hypothetical protein